MKRMTLHALETLVSDHNNRLCHMMMAEKKAELKKLEDELPPKDVVALVADMEGVGREIDKKEAELNKLRYDYAEIGNKALAKGWIVRDKDHCGKRTNLEAKRKGIHHVDSIQQQTLQADPRYVNLAKAVLAFEHGTEDDRREFLVTLGVIKADAPKD